jgi:16S rRNA (guanine966-N2)-methyltransferase
VEARASIRRNVETLQLTGAPHLAARRDESGPAGTMQLRPRADPPYGKELGQGRLTAAEGGWIREGAIAVLEERTDTEILLPADFEEIDTRAYGDTKLIVMRAFPAQAPRRAGGPGARDMLE